MKSSFILCAYHEYILEGQIQEGEFGGEYSMTGVIYKT